jgi:Fe-S-cluster-containing hydrogenase component 2
MCNYGCVFQNDCVAACMFGAIRVNEQGMREIDEEKCTACGACVRACPRGLIELVPVSRKVHVLCASHDKGKEAKVRCGNNNRLHRLRHVCEEVPVGAITLQGDLAVIDYEKCISCGLCANVCPTKAIVDPLAGTRGKAVIRPADCIGQHHLRQKCPWAPLPAS